MREPPPIVWWEWLALVVLMAVVLGIIAAVDRPTYKLALTLLAVVLTGLAVLFARQQR